MPSAAIAAASLAVIAIAVLVALLYLVPALIEARRAAARITRTIDTLDAALPGLLAELTDAVATMNKTAETAVALAGSIERLNRLSATTARVVAGVLGAIEQTGRGMLVPSLANVAGVLSVVREGMEMVRSRRDRRRNGT